MTISEEEQQAAERMAQAILTLADNGNPTARRIVALAVWDVALTRALADLDEDLQDPANYFQVFDDDGYRLVDGRPGLRSCINDLRQKMQASFERRSLQLVRRLSRGRR